MKFDRLLARYTYQGQFLLENLLPGLRGVAIGSNLATIDMSGVTTLTLPSGTTIGGSSVVALATITSTTANALTVGPAGTTNPSFNVDASTGSAVTGLNIKSAATGAGIAVSALDSGLNTALTLDAKGTGILALGSISTGVVVTNRGALKALVNGVTLTSLATQSITPTAAQTLGGAITHASVTGAGTCTFVSGTTLSAAVPSVAVGDSFVLVYANTGNQTVTLTGATGTTIVGTAAVTTGKNALITFVNTGTNTWNLYCQVSA